MTLDASCIPGHVACRRGDHERVGQARHFDREILGDGFGEVGGGLVRVHVALAAHPGDATTGEELWRTYTIPGPGEPGHETWEDDHGEWMTGAGALLRAAHAGPALAVTVLTALLAVSAALGPARGALVTAAVLPGQINDSPRPLTAGHTEARCLA